MLPEVMGNALQKALSERILILDGAMGTMIQRHDLTESDFRGSLFANHSADLFGCNDLLSITQPEIIFGIHSAYLAAGANIIETNTFNATRISMADYGLEGEVHAINVAAAQVARRATQAHLAQNPEQLCLVAGSIGPTNKTATLSPDVNDPAFREVTFEDLRANYYEQVAALMEGGVDILLPETTFDTLNLKAALFAIEQVFEETGTRIPVIASVTIVDKSGRTLSGQTVEAFWLSIEHANLTAVGINCALGGEQMRPFVEALSECAPIPLLCYPNAGLPNEMGGYDESPEQSAAILADFAGLGWLNLAGGCCGTTPDHIRAIADALKDKGPRVPPEPSNVPQWSGLEPYAIFEGTTFSMIGERTNVAGSRKFRDLILAGDFETATQVARAQVEGGANLLDVNMDEGLLDAPPAMQKFLNQIAAEPDISRLPVMVDSSDFAVIEAGLQCLQGKGVVNSISLKEGEEDFVEKAKLIRRYGASVIVMAFDEQGQATSTERRTQICERAYKLLTQECNFAPHDIIFDPNVLAIGTGMEEHNDYGVTFIESCRQIKERCPGALLSGGISNLSFAFRGNNHVREAIHAVFLYHAIHAGLDMGIVNAGQLAVYDEIEAELLELTEDLVLNRRPDATERMLDYAARHKGDNKQETKTLAWREEPLAERIIHSLLLGNADFVDPDMAEALSTYPTPLSVIEGPLMDGMNVVGELFGDGKMFLPQVVKSARVMKKAVAILEPHMDHKDGQKQASIVMATVKGDVHDIGKNIVAVVLRCNGIKVHDLGVMVRAETILEKAIEVDAQMIGLSGLITPSLHEMAHVAQEMERRDFHLPLLIGGATTSQKHTAVKIAPEYSKITIQVADASKSVAVVRRLLNDSARAELDTENRNKQAKLRRRYEEQQGAMDLLPIESARKQGFQWEKSGADIHAPPFTGVKKWPIANLSELRPYIDWGPFFLTWELRAGYKKMMDDPQAGEQYRQLMDDALKMLDSMTADRRLNLAGVYGFYPANRCGDDLLIYADESRSSEVTRFHMLRQQKRHRVSGRPYYCLSDFVAPVDSQTPDYLGVFAVTAGLGLHELVAEFEADDDDYSAIMAKALADRLAEAMAERLHQKMRAEWGIGTDDSPELSELVKENYRGIRPAFGYPACPDHSEKRSLFELLQAEALAGIRLSENFAMLPAASVSGLVFAHPEARYFAVGPAGPDQLGDYAQRKGEPTDTLKRWLGATSP
jgi:5-methyltetrahydrofolate--homocysteine methyltransferase